MMKILISSMMMLMSLIMFFLNHPISMGLMILMQTILTCLITGMLIKTYWFSYILFLTFLGGLLVLFIYVTSIASNELFNTSLKMKMILLTMTMLMILFSFLYMNNLNWMNFSNNSEMNNFKMMMFFNNENKISLNKLYNQQTYLLMTMMIIYLFITLIAVVKITNIFFGPLRPYS